MLHMRRIKRKREESTFRSLKSRSLKPRRHGVADGGDGEADGAVEDIEVSAIFSKRYPDHGLTQAF